MRILLVFIFVFSFGFDYYKVYTLKDFPEFKIYPVKGSYINRILNMKKSEITQKQKQQLIYIYEKEKMIRDILLILNKKYHYKFMPYIAMLTQQHLYIFKKFFKKYNIPIPKDEQFVGKFDNMEIQKEYKILLEKSLQDKKMAAELSVGFMSDLIGLYYDVIYDAPKDIKRMLLKLNAFNKKVLYRFKKGLRNIEIGLPVE